jgi:hypothetical protein
MANFGNIHREESKTMTEKYKIKIALLVALIFCFGTTALLARNSIGRGALGGAIKGGIIGQASGGKAGRGALVGAGIGAIQTSAQQQNARQQQAEAERARTREMQARQAQRDAEARARRTYEAKLRQQEQRQEHVDFRQQQQQQQINAISGAQQIHIDMYQHPQAWDERTRQDMQMIEQRYGNEAINSMRKRIAKLQKARDAVLKKNK